MVPRRPSTCTHASQPHVHAPRQWWPRVRYVRHTLLSPHSHRRYHYYRPAPRPRTQSLACLLSVVKAMGLMGSVSWYGMSRSSISSVVSLVCLGRRGSRKRGSKACTCNRAHARTCVRERRGLRELASRSCIWLHHCPWWYHCSWWCLGHQRGCALGPAAPILLANTCSRRERTCSLAVSARNCLDVMPARVRVTRNERAGRGVKNEAVSTCAPPPLPRYGLPPSLASFVAATPLAHAIARAHLERWWLE